MATLLETFSTDILTPVQEPGDARQDAVAFGPSLTIRAGQSVAIKTADKKAYAFASGGADGTESWKGFSMYGFRTDASGKVYFGDTATASYRTVPESTAPIWKSGIFDPMDITTDATLVAQVDTFTPGGTIEIGDIFTLTLTATDATTHAVSYTAAAATAADVAAGLVAAWNASDDEYISRITASGTVTVILTADNPGEAFSVAGTTTESDGAAADAQTFTRAATTANAGRELAEILAACPGARILHNGFLLIPG